MYYLKNHFLRIRYKKSFVKIQYRYLVMILLGGMPVLNAQAQENLYDDIKKYYKQIEISENTYSPPVKFISQNEIPAIDGRKIFQIMLIRHGVPKIEKKGWVTFYDARDFVEAYDTVEIYEIKKSPVEVRSGEVQHVYSSPLQRAKSTALLLFGEDYEIRYDSSFIEFKNEIIPLPWIRLPLKCWRVSSRLIWMAGLHSSRVRSLPTEKQRTRGVAARLDRLAHYEKRVVLVAHGFFNRYLIRYLKKKGWRHSFDGGFDYTNVQVLTKIEE